MSRRSGRPTRHRVGPTTEPYVRISRIRLFEKSLITAGGATEILLDGTVKAAIAARLETGSCPSPALGPAELPASECGSDFLICHFLFPPRPSLPGHYSAHR